ncbi:hypothetical protein Tco_1371654, partial [Tanacetum coccineum]
MNDLPVIVLSDEDSDAPVRTPTSNSKETNNQRMKDLPVIVLSDEDSDAP